jgi:hypothetical protein
METSVVDSWIDVIYIFVSSSSVREGTFQLLKGNQVMLADENRFI